MTTSRFAPEWRVIGLGAVVGAAGTAAVGLAAYGAVTVVGALTAGQTVGANIGLGIVAFALRLVATPLVCWWLLRRARVARPAVATGVAAACYLVLAPTAGWAGAALPGAAAAWAVLGGICGALGVYAAGRLAPRAPAPRV
ncbi:hypothetical protein [Streptomonospora salina]|uniref:Uncharacterized protein n=1 Tax=Streptomonospora salina TaxID=104205 RepID=A0A841EDQ2_9ACTN|nr:hypothetical protein [Streptomonospora salina]MBB6001292.1 hypothetical protein [Streptomonospora salina]